MASSNTWIHETLHFSMYYGPDFGEKIYIVVAAVAAAAASPQVSTSSRALGA
jgi:hypothetical protein